MSDSVPEFGRLAPAEVSAAVIEQYDDHTQRLFYKVTMGGGSHDIHYGIFRSETDGVREASNNSTDFMLSCMDWARPVTADSVVLDLGSGHGGSAHALVKRFNCSVRHKISNATPCAFSRAPASCFNLCPQQNEVNAERCAELGIAERVTMTLGDFNQPWPPEWTGAFDYVWSAEALCHAADKRELFAELARCLRPGGVLVFSDIMGSDDVEEELLRAFTARNATTQLGRPAEYQALIKASGLKSMAWWDNSHHLEPYFRGMLSQIDRHVQLLTENGVSVAYLDKWRASLRERADTQKEHAVFTWGVFVARKPW